MSSWYSEHPVVSTVLWLMGNTVPIEEEEEPKKPARCLSWKDEHDGSPIAEYMTTPKNPPNEVRFGKIEEKTQQDRDNTMSRMQSLPALPRTDSDVDKYTDFKTEDETMSPQWGWYVSTTPPQEMYGQRPRHS